MAKEPPLCDRCWTNHWNFQPHAEQSGEPPIEKETVSPGGAQPWGRPWHESNFGPPKS